MDEIESKLLTEAELAEIAGRAERDRTMIRQGWISKAILDRRRLLAHIRALEEARAGQYPEPLQARAATP